MSLDDSATSLALTGSTAKLAVRLSKKLGLTVQEVVERAIRLAANFSADESRTSTETFYLMSLREKVGDLRAIIKLFEALRNEESILVDRPPESDTSQLEDLMILKILQGQTLETIAVELDEDPSQTRAWESVKRKLRDTPVAGNRETTATKRLEAFEKLKRNLELTPAKASEWEGSIRDARR